MKNVKKEMKNVKKEMKNVKKEKEKDFENDVFFYWYKKLKATGEYKTKNQIATEMSYILDYSKSRCNSKISEYERAGF